MGGEVGEVEEKRIAGVAGDEREGGVGLPDATKARIAEALGWLQGRVVARWGLERGDAEVLRGFMREALGSLASGAAFPGVAGDLLEASPS